MPLLGTRIGTGAAKNFKKAVEDHVRRITPTDKDDNGNLVAKSQEEIEESLERMYNDMGDSIVNEFKPNAQVPSGIPVATAGSATNQLGSTTSPGTII